MAKRRYSFDEEKFARFQKEKRGQGAGAEYRPWLTIHDISSTGRSSRIHCRKTGREHHLFSDLETSLFLLLDWSDVVTDIREQFPLDRDITRRITTEIDVKHPADSHTNSDIVMTTDFLIDIRRDGKSQTIARSVKPSSALDDSRTLEKQEIERRYWQKNGVDWGLVTELDLPIQRIKNLRWLHEMQSLQHLVAPYANYWEDRCDSFLAFLPQTNGMSVQQVIRLLEGTHGFAAGEGLSVLRHLAANKRIDIDLDSKFAMSMPIDTFCLDVLTTLQPRRKIN